MNFDSIDEYLDYVKEGPVLKKGRFGFFQKAYMKLHESGRIIVLNEKQTKVKQKIEVDEIV